MELVADMFLSVRRYSKAFVKSKLVQSRDKSWLMVVGSSDLWYLKVVKVLVEIVEVVDVYVGERRSDTRMR